MLKKGNVSDIIATARKRHNDDYDEVVEELTKELQLYRGKGEFLTEFHDREEDVVDYEYEPTERYSKIILSRKSRQTTESEWKEVRIEISPSPAWDGTFNLECFLNGEKYGFYPNEKIGLDGFLNQQVFVSKFQNLFNVKTPVSAE